MKVVFYSFANLSGALSRWSTRSDWSHVDCLFDDGTVIGAMKEGVQRMYLSERLAGPRKVKAYRIDIINLPKEYAAFEFAKEQVGAGYDWSGMVGMFLPAKQFELQDQSRWFCSELVAAAIEAGGVKIARYSNWRLSPGFLDCSPLLHTLAGPITLVV